jgi:hypothetical protein
MATNGFVCWYEMIKQIFVDNMKLNSHCSNLSAVAKATRSHSLGASGETLIMDTTVGLIPSSRGCSTQTLPVP